MPSISRLLIFILFLLLNELASIGQGLPNSKLNATVGFKRAVHFYYEYSKENSPLYNGEEYLPYNFKMFGNPFFDSTALVFGSVCYSGINYRHVPMFFDLVRQQLVIKGLDDKSYIVLNPHQVDSFKIFDHTFIRIDGDQIRHGFYDMLFRGKVKLYSFRIKDFQKDIEGLTLYERFFQENRFFVQKNGFFFPIDGKRDIMKIFTNRIGQIRKFIRKNKIRFDQKKIEIGLIKVISYYDTMINANGPQN